MKFFVVIGLVVIIAIVLTQVHAYRFAKTLFLIHKAEPYVRPIPGAPQVLVLGDSTGYGTGVTASKESVAGRLGSEFPKYSVLNNSKNGRTIGELMPVAKKVVGEYALILIQIGGNDILQKRDVHEVEKELREIIKQLDGKTDNLVMLSTGNVGGASIFTGKIRDEYESISRAYRSMFLRVAETTFLSYVDLFLEPEVDVFILEPDVYLALDGLHPSSAGYALWYEKLQPVVQNKLEK